MGKMKGSAGGPGLGGAVLAAFLLAVGGIFVLLSEEQGRLLFRMTRSGGAGGGGPSSAWPWRLSTDPAGGGGGGCFSIGEPGGDADRDHGIAAMSGGGSAGGVRMALQPAGIALHPFVFFSAYRMNGSTLYVLGLVSRLVLDGANPVFLCEWHSDDWDSAAAAATQPPAPTKASLLPSATGYANLPYVEVVLECRFPRDVGMDGRGGALNVTVQAAPQAGEVRTLRAHKAPVVTVATLEALREPPTPTGAPRGFQAQPPYRYKYAVCSAPISGAIRASLLREWFIYHLALYNEQQQQPEGGTGAGANAPAGRGAHFFLYNVGGLDARARAVLAPLVAAGLVTVLETVEQAAYPAWWTSQTLFMNDCVHRSRFLADWVAFHDFDEFVYVAPPRTLAGLLADYAANSSAAMLTLGSWEIGVEACMEESGSSDGHVTQEWPLSRMLWRAAHPECQNRSKEADPGLCPGSLGRRKYVLNPRTEVTVAVHRTLGDSYRRAVHLHASVARVEHYRGIFSLDKRPCAQIRHRRTAVGDSLASSSYSWSKYKREMECSICPRIPDAMSFVAAMSLPDLLVNCTTLTD